jgi:uracil-DNA glycosylase
MALFDPDSPSDERPPPPIPPELTLESLNPAAQRGRPGERLEQATQAVDAELAMVGPDALVFLGAPASQALLGSGVRIGRDRGRRMESSLAGLVTLTSHPSAILRQRDEAQRAAALDGLVSDLTAVGSWRQER